MLIASWLSLKYLFLLLIFPFYSIFFLTLELLTQTRHLPRAWLPQLLLSRILLVLGHRPSFRAAVLDSTNRGSCSNYSFIKHFSTRSAHEPEVITQGHPNLLFLLRRARAAVSSLQPQLHPPRHRPPLPHRHSHHLRRPPARYRRRLPLSGMCCGLTHSHLPSGDPLCLPQNPLHKTGRRQGRSVGRTRWHDCQ